MAEAWIICGQGKQRPDKSVRVVWAMFPPEKSGQNFYRAVSGFTRKSLRTFGGHPTKNLYNISLLWGAAVGEIFSNQIL